MTSPSISSSNAGRVASARSSEPQGARQQPNPQDVRAMQDALAKAKQLGERGAQPKLAKGIVGKGKEGEQFAAAMREGHQSARALYEEAKGDRFDRNEGFGSSSGLALATPGGFQPLPMTSPPPPTVDPSGFAQMMAHLWSRENGKGAKEVRVRFGEATWPATGARLVRNAAGALDVQLHMGAGQRAGDDALDGLRRGFAENGVALGALSVAEGEA